VVELLGRYRRTLQPGIHLLIPFIESVHANVNMREQVANFVQAMDLEETFAAFVEAVPLADEAGE
jgi:regulator of protease activity HflC (stomatin/prohibitin superfamily)